MIEKICCNVKNEMIDDWKFIYEGSDFYEY
jgi:hypothetical protein